MILVLGIHIAIIVAYYKHYALVIKCALINQWLLLIAFVIVLLIDLTMHNNDNNWRKKQLQIGNTSFLIYWCFQL